MCLSPKRRNCQFVITKTTFCTVLKLSEHDPRLTQKQFEIDRLQSAIISLRRQLLHRDGCDNFDRFCQLNLHNRLQAEDSTMLAAEAQG
jgi:hypothetical protein